MGNKNSSGGKKKKFLKPTITSTSVTSSISNISNVSNASNNHQNTAYLSPNSDRITRISNELLRKNFTQIESYSLRATFENLSTTNEIGIPYINEGAFVGYLGFPDDVGAGPLIYRSFIYLANIHSNGHTNTLLTYDGLIKAVAVYCDKTKDVIDEDRVKLLFDSFSISIDEQNSPAESDGSSPKIVISNANANVDDNNDEFLKAIGLHHEIDPSKTSKVRCQDMVKILTGLIWLMSSEMSSISTNSQDLLANLKKIVSPKFINQIREDVIHVVERMHISQHNNSVGTNAMDSDEVITWPTFQKFVDRNAPSIFRGFIPFMYGQFLIGLTLSQQRQDSLFQGPKVQYWPKLDTHSDLLNQMNMGLLSWMLPEKVIKRHHWNCLYSSSRHGFSTNRFSSHVFKYPGPTLMLIHAEISKNQNRELISISPNTKGSLPTSKPNKLEDHVSTLLLGAYVSEPWKSTSNPKTCFGSEECALFEVWPVFEKFPASKMSSNYVYYNPSFGIGFGGIATSGTTSNTITVSEQNTFTLQIDNTLQYGRYRNDVLRADKPTYSLSVTRNYFDIPFEVLEIEVFGLGGELAKEKQEKEWEWEEAEVAKRNGLQVKRNSNKEADREFLKLSGVIDEDSRREVQIWEP
ncbi:13196_t:CDS:2 [Funneliformis caledonium]|uniref:Restriction of telomere capping protein 5 n=1 Tax=Funneliformis caledonium TaxID=1117310 RepID=A0A9N9F0G5_9GLOM|nr:13196_t:CDS:2 [Funneliformis caledonium]